MWLRQVESLSNPRLGVMKNLNDGTQNVFNYRNVVLYYLFIYLLFDWVKHSSFSFFFCWLRTVGCGCHVDLEWLQKLIPCKCASRDHFLEVHLNSVQWFTRYIWKQTEKCTHRGQNLYLLPLRGKNGSSLLIWATHDRHRPTKSYFPTFIFQFQTSASWKSTSTVGVNTGSSSG